MQPSRELPPHYELHGTLDISKSRLMTAGMNMAAAGSFFLFGWIALQFLRMTRSDAGSIVIGLSGRLGIVDAAAVIVAISVLVILQIIVVVLHEAAHGVFFWYFTRERPVFGLKLPYAAYAAARRRAWPLPPLTLRPRSTQVRDGPGRCALCHPRKLRRPASRGRLASQSLATLLWQSARTRPRSAAPRVRPSRCALRSRSPLPALSLRLRSPAPRHPARATALAVCLLTSDFCLLPHMAKRMMTERPRLDGHLSPSVAFVMPLC